MAQWKIRRRQGECSACDHVFADGERHASVLRVDGEELQRGDLCDTCWKAHDGEEDLIWWFTRHEVDKKRTVALDLATMERLFLELEGKGGPALQEVRYLLCLLLMRKRRLKLERVKRAKDGELLIMRRPRRKELHEVQVFDFDAERMDELRGRLQEVLEGASFDEEDGGSSTDEAAERRPAGAGEAEASGDASGDGDAPEDDSGDDDTGDDDGVDVAEVSHAELTAPVDDAR